ncbi:MAG: TIM-barrel domain-containing protein [Thermoplasmata archaeon]|jgi:alpha-D-xyloside xylohydrolase
MLRFGAVRPRSGSTGTGVTRRRVRFGELDVHLEGRPLGLSVQRRGETVFETATELPPGKLRGPSPWGTQREGVTVPLRFIPGERVFGAGEFFGPLDRVGQELRTSVRDVFGLPNDGSYVTYPFFWSTRGYALLVESWAPVRLDFGRRYLGLGELDIPKTPVTVRLFFSKSPREILRWFWDRRGAPTVPPLWSYGVWYSRCAYRDQGELLRVARKIRTLGLPADVIHLDPPWLDQPLPDALYAVGRRLGLSRAKVDGSAERDPGDVLAGLAAAAARRGWSLPFFGVGCTFRWNHRRFPDPARMIRELHQSQLRLSLWINPYIPAHTPEYRYLRAHDLLVRRGDGKIGLQFDHPSVDLGGVDFSHPDGRKWFAERIAELVRLGVDVIKTDFGEAIPEDGYGRGIGAPELHNRYATLYPETVFRAVRGSGGDAMVWGRSGGLDIHRYPIQWGGDPRTHPRDMAAALRGALSYAASGGAFTSFDSGGFGGRPTPELYIRWMQMGMFFSHTRLHGTTPREPWNFGPRALAIFRKFAALRYRLIPYLYSQSIEGIGLGRPLVRPIAVDCPDDPAAAVEDEYFLGEHLLVAPVVPGARSEIVLPRGDWYDFWTGRRVADELPSRRRIPLDSLPVYVRSGAVIPLTAKDHDHTDPDMLLRLTLRTYGPVNSARLDFGEYGKLRVSDLRRPRGRSGAFRWTVERFDP